MSKLKLCAAALAMSVAALAGVTMASDTADARVVRRVVVFKTHPHRHFHHRHSYVVPLVTTGPGCGIYWRRWELTGRLYWKRRYYECIG